MIKMNFKLDKIKLKENNLEQEIKSGYDFFKKNDVKADRTFSFLLGGTNCECDNVCKKEWVDDDGYINCPSDSFCMAQCGSDDDCKNYCSAHCFTY